MKHLKNYMCIVTALYLCSSYSMEKQSECKKFTLQNRMLELLKNIKNKKITNKYFNNENDENQLFNTVCLETFQINNKNNNSDNNDKNNDDSFYIFEIFDTCDLTEALKQELDQQKQKIEFAQQQFQESTLNKSKKKHSNMFFKNIFSLTSFPKITQEEIEKINQQFQETEQYAKIQQETTSIEYLYTQYKELIKHALSIISNKNSFNPKTYIFEQNFSFTTTSDNEIKIPAGTSLSQINEGYDMGRQLFKPGIQGLKVFCIEGKLNFIVSFPNNIKIEEKSFEEYISNLKKYFESEQGFNKTSDFNFLKQEEFELLFKTEPLFQKLIASYLGLSRENKNKQTPEFNLNDPYYIIISER